MKQQDFTRRMVVVARGDIEGWQSANAIAHISAYLGNQLQDTFGTGDTFVSSDNAAYPRNSQYPIIIKRAGSSEQLRTLLDKIRLSGRMYHAFIREMIDYEDDFALQEALSKKSDAEIELLGVGVFGPNDELATLTKKFGLWR